MKRSVVLVIAILVVVGGAAFYLGTRLSSNGTQQTTSPPPVSVTPPGKPPKNPFGVFLSPRVFDVDTRVRIAQELGVRYFRGFPALVPGWNGQCDECGPVHDAGLDFVLSIRNTSNEQSPAGPVSDFATYKKTVGDMLDQYKPALAVVENEEDVPRYFSGTADQYAAELKAACEVAHQHKVKCANGGITYTGVTWLTYQHYVDAGETDKAQSFAQRGLDPSQQSRLNSPQGQQLIREIVDHVMCLISHYKDAGIDYMNIHWYLPDAGAFQEVVQYMQQLTGLPVVTNEIGEQRTEDPNIVKGLLQAIVALKMPIGVWFSSDIGFARGLVNPDGSIRSNGSAFASFVKSHAS
jgi:hypothetical protein